MITRRGLLSSSCAALGLTAVGGKRLLASDGPPRDALLPLWEAWKPIHLSSRGRVIDRLQDNISHSEGQGYGLLLAEAIGDREGFDLILDWTLANLAVRDDALLAWRWHPAEGGRVTDTNNASDGDLFFAWALVRAAERFGEERYHDLALATATDLARVCLQPAPDTPGSLLLVPGAKGFRIDDGWIVNPAYLMPRALGEVGAKTGVGRLADASADAIALLARLARDQLVPDWVAVTADGLAPAEGKSFAFGYEAMRVPLFLVWSDLPGHPAVTRAREAYAAALDVTSDETPTEIDPATGAVVAASSDPGYRALAALTSCAGSRGADGLMPAFSPGQPYYPSVLHLLSLLAQRESNLVCHP